MIASELLGVAAMVPAVVAAVGWSGQDWFEYDFQDDQVLERDVLVVGGGASGAHAATRLREDFGKTILLVEKVGRLGGHTATYQDEETGNYYNYGIQTLVDYGRARDFVEGLNITLGSLARVASNRTYIDFTTGEAVDGYVPPPQDASSAAMAKFSEISQQYAEYIAPGYWDFFGPGDDIPEDLTMPFGDFVEKYDLAALVPTIFEITIMGLGDPLPVPTLYVMQGFGSAIASNGPSFNPTSGNNLEIYERIEELLSDDVRVNSIVGQVRRSDDGIEAVIIDLVLEKPVLLVRAKQLLIAFEPTVENMEFMDMDEEEEAVFGLWEWTDVQCGIIRHAGLPVGYSLDNTPAAAAPDHYLELPTVPFVARLDWMGSDLFRMLMVGDEEAYEEDWASLDDVDAAVKRILGTGAAGDASQTGTNVTVIAYRDHGPMHLHVSEEELKGGFIQRQYALQGRRSTWYTGAAWSMQFTTVLWEFNESLLPRMLDGL